MGLEKLMHKCCTKFLTFVLIFFETFLFKGLPEYQKPLLPVTYRNVLAFPHKFPST